MLFSFTAFAQPKGKGREIVGSIVDVDGKPVAGATVSISGGASVTTGADGAFKLTGVPATNLSIEVIAEGFTVKQVPVLGAATALQLQIAIVKPVVAAPPPIETRMVGGVVTDASHAPLAGATVRVHGTQIQTVTAADGSFTLPGVAVTDVTLDVEAANQPAASVVVAANRAAVVVAVGTAAAAPVTPATRTVRGKVVDPTSGAPIAGAQVQVVGTDKVVFSEADGTFVVEGAAAGAVKLDVTAPEYEPHVVDMPANIETISIPLALAKGEQIVIVGRAPSITKQSPTGGASVIDGADLSRVSAATLDDAMTAKVAGANLQQNSGAPGGGAQLRLRGISTINGQTSPLYVIDGVIISNASTSSGSNAVTGAAGGGNPSNQDNPVNRVADLNPNDIENVEILKGSAAAALYGSKAANGVVIITTKRGRQGENHASVTQRIGFSQVSKKYGSRQWNSVDEVKDAFCGVRHDAAEEAKCTTNAYVTAYESANGQTFDHEAEIERTPFMMETLANVSGGTENGNYYGSVLINDEPAVMIGTFYKKQTGRVAIGYKFGERLKMGLTANVLHSESDRGLTNNDNNGVSQYNIMSATPNFIDVRPKNGVYPTNVGLSANPIQIADLLQNREEVTRFIAGGTAQLDVVTTADNVHRVKLLGNVGVDAFNQDNTLISPSSLTFEGDDGLFGTIVKGTTSNTNFNIGTSVVWQFSPVSGAFRSGTTAGVTYESVDNRPSYVISSNLTGGNEAINTATVVRTNQNFLATKEFGSYLQEELSFLDDRLSVLGGLLAERSSLNGDTEKYFFYPKLGAAYSLLAPAKTGERSALEMFETLRVRAAYGETGNRPNYGNKFTALLATNVIGGTAGLIVANNFGDAEIEPERQREFEGGVDLATKDQRVVLELTGYQRNISNMLLQRQLPTSTGFNTQFLNGGSMFNRGLEAALAVKPVATTGLDWTSRATLTFNRSEVTELPDGIPAFIVPVGFGATLGAFRIEEGKSATQLVALVDGTLTVVGDGEPDFRIGWSNVVNVSDFTFTALLDWQQGSEVVNLTRNYYDANHNAPDPEAAEMRVASLDAGDPRPYIEDASFLKVREISVAYTLPKRIASQLGPLKSLQFQVSGRNLLTLTNYSGLDPEVSNFGAQAIGRNYDVTPYPPSRTYWFSVTAGI